MTEQDSDSSPAGNNNESAGFLVWALNLVERIGNKLPDPAVLFLIGMVATWILSALLSNVQFKEIDPRSGDKKEPVRVVNLLTLKQAARFLAGEDKEIFVTENGQQRKKVVTEGGMVDEFVRFPPLGVVLVALLGVGVAEHSGFISACLKNLLRLTPQKLLTPMLLLVAIMSHTAADAGYVLVIPLGGIIFYAAGRHPLAGIAAAFAGVSGGFSACFVPTGIDPLLSGITQPAAGLIDADYSVNPLCNIFFTAASSVLVIVVGWFLTDCIVEPRLRGTKVDGDPEEMPKMDALTPRDQAGMWCGLATVLIAILLLVLWAWPADSALRAPDGSLTSYRPSAPLMHAIVPLIFLLFVMPGVVHGFVSGTFKSHRDVIKGMTHSMKEMGYYLVLVFFAALFIASFRDSNIGVLIAIKGAAFLQQTGAPPAVTIVGVILLVALVNLLIGSASAKWAMLAPIFVPMLMLAGLSPEMTQAAYRVGDSCTNIITPMMPYFPLVVVFCQRYVKNTGIGTVAAMMLPFSVTLLIVWTLFLLAYWGLGIPLGLQAPYTYAAPG